MNIKIKRLIMLNQMAGPLFRELSEDLAPLYDSGAVLITGHPDTLALKDTKVSNLTIKKAPEYNRNSWTSRVLSWFQYVLFISKSVLCARAGDGILLVSNPPILGVWVWLLTRLNKIPYAVLVLDIHPEVYIRLGVLENHSLVVTLWNAMNRLVYRNANAVITIGKRMANLVNAQIPLGAPGVAVVPLWVDVDNIKPLPRNKNPYAQDFIKSSDEFIVLYSGNMGSSHDIDSMLSAAKHLNKNRKIRFLFIGEGEKYKDVEVCIQKERLANVSLFPFQPEALIKYTLPLADVALVSLDQGMEDLMIPSKSFYYLAAGSAIVAIANENSELSDLLGQRACGVLVPPGDPNALAAALKNLQENPKKLAMMKKNARQLAEEKFSRQACTTEFARVLTQSDLL